jgi:hypothetical protein
MSSERRYWFPAKRYGWGWGPPTTWQGWIVVVLYFGLIITGIVVWPPRRDLAAFLVWATFLTGLLMAICWIKGEPPGWRDGR